MNRTSGKQAYWRIQLASAVSYCAVMTAFPPHMLAKAPQSITRVTQFKETEVIETDPFGIPDVRMATITPDKSDWKPNLPTRLIIFSTPNGNTIEQTLGRALGANTDWRFDIQHIAAQTRRLREVNHRENIVLVCIQSKMLSWPAWRAKYKDANAKIAQIIAELFKRQVAGTKLAITGHSGGGSFLHGIIEAYDHIPDFIDRIGFLDANYSFTAEDHGRKLIEWLNKNNTNQLTIIAYDDRNITLNGKLVVGPTGGTYRASYRTIDAFKPSIPLHQSTYGDFEDWEALKGRCKLYIHKNPENKILHTVLVGEMNGFLAAMTLGTPEEAKWGRLGTPRAYTKWIEAAEVPAKTAAANLAESLSDFTKRIEALTPPAREEEIVKALTGAGLPPIITKFVPVNISGLDANGAKHYATIYVSPDYLSFGTDADYIRIPMTPASAKKIAEFHKCILPTPKIVDAIYERAAVKLEPRPLTHDREAIASFKSHSEIIDTQLKEWPGGKYIPGMLVAGTKKDIVQTIKLKTVTGKVAIYGWHMPDGRPIQPVTTVHKDTYVDYSHGVRLILRDFLLDGKTMDLQDVLKDPILSPLFSDEGPLAP